MSLEEVDQECLRKLLTEGGTFCLLDMPVGSEFGIDMQMWTTGEKFRGVKMIPPGLHFVYFSVVNNGQVAPRTGFFHDFQSREFIAKRWDKRSESIVDVSKDDCERLKINIKQLDAFLGAYPYESLAKWVSLTDKMTQDVTSKLQPINQLIYSVEQFHPARFPPEPGTDTAKIPELKAVESTAIRFTKFPATRHPPGSTMSDITKYGMDSSYVLQSLITSAQSADNLLAEIQFSFVTFLVGQLYEGFEQWKRLLHVICTSEECMGKPELQEFFTNFISILHFQIKEIPTDFFVDIVSRENFLTSTLSLFFKNAEDSCADDTELYQKAKRFKIFLTRHFRWDFDQEPDDEAPVIVE